MTPNQLIYDVREKLKLGSDDIDVSNEYLYHLINVKRAYLLKQRFSKTSRNLPEEVKQIICVPMVETNDYEGICEGGKKILKSVSVIPSTIEIGGKSAIVSIRSKTVTGKHLNIVSIERLPHVGYSKYLQNQMYIAMDADNKLYMTTTGGPSFIEDLKVTGVFANPEDAYNLSCDKDRQDNCDFYDATYPIEPYIVNDAINMIVKELAPSLSIMDDKINNSDESNR